MANECLVQTLKGEVSQDLPILNAIRIDKKNEQESFNTNYYLLITPVSGKTVVCSLDGNKVFLSGSGQPMGNVENVTYANYLHLPLSPCRIIIKNKSNLKGFSTTFGSSAIIGSLSEFSYCSNLESLDATFEGELASLSKCPALKTIKIRSGSTITGELSELSDCSLLEDVFIFVNIDSDISELGGNTALKTIYLVGSKFYGSIESFVSAQRSAGRTSVASGSALTINLAGADITFNGSNACTAQDTPLYWDATTITYNGVTITA